MTSLSRTLLDGAHGPRELLPPTELAGPEGEWGGLAVADGHHVVRLHEDDLHVLDIDPPTPPCKSGVFDRTACSR